jgi:hypothetical protein
MIKSLVIQEIRSSSFSYSLTKPSRHHTYALLKYVFIFLAAGLLFTGCSDNITTLGAQYFTDTIANKTSIRSDAAFIQFADTLRPFVTANGIPYTLTDSTTLMIIGKVSVNNENLESWGFLQFPPLTSATDSTIIGVRLLLKDQVYKYGDTTSATSSDIHFQVYGVYGPVSDVMDSFSVTELTNLMSTGKAVPVGAIDTTFPDSTDRVLAITLTSAAFPLLAQSFNAFVITPTTPKASMTNARGFGTIHSYGDVNSVPQIEYYYSNGDSSFVYPTLDFHIVHDMTVTPQNEFTLRGSTGKREKIFLNLAIPKDTTDMQLDQFTTVNNATLVLHLDAANSSHSNNSGDTIGPDVVQLGLVDSANHYDGNGYLDPSDPTRTTYRFQLRGVVQNWLRYPTQNFGFELSSGYSTRSFDAAAPESIGVEDNTLNRWTFFGPGYSDSTKRPYFILSYSKLK